MEISKKPHAKAEKPSAVTANKWLKSKNKAVKKQAATAKECLKWDEKAEKNSFYLKFKSRDN